MATESIDQSTMSRPRSSGVPVGDAEDAPLEQKADLPVYLLRLSGFVMTRLAKASTFGRGL
jgi:hypothetical protein